MSATLTNKTIEAGAYGWEYAKWRGSFYPAELPSDWHFSYYCQLYKSAILPFEHLNYCLHSSQDEQATEWLSDLSNDFSLFIEIQWHCLDDRLFINSLTSFIDQLDIELSGFILTISESVQIDVVERLLITWFSSFKQPLHLALTGQSLECWRTLVAQFSQLHFCFSVGYPWLSGCSLLLLDTTLAATNMRQYGDLLKQFNRQADALKNYVFIMGQPPDKDLLATTQSLLEFF